jgi:hypothetical protein
MIPTGASNLKYKDWQERLKQDLLFVALQQHGHAGQQTVADAIGISRQALYQWQRMINKKKGQNRP